MNKKQKETLLDLGMDTEVKLDSVSPRGFLRYAGFGTGYVDYVRDLRGLEVVSEVRSLLDPGTDTSDITEPPYEKQAMTYHPLEDGSVDVRMTVNLSASTARWLEDLVRRLPEMYRNDPPKQDIGFHLSQKLLETLRLDKERHGDLSNGEMGTMPRKSFEGMKGASQTYT